jgi:recombination protein RecT
MTSQEIERRTPQQQLVAKLRSNDSQIQLSMALEGSEISVSRFTRIAITAFNENPDLAKADEGSVFSSLVRCATDGLVPDGREAALVLFGQKAVYMAMVQGLRKIAAEYGWSIVAAVVHENDSFDPDYENARANYKPVRLGMDPGNAIGAYAIGQHKDGRQLLEVMNLEEIEAVRATSRAAQSGPWVQWWGEMARKTVVRRLFKSLPLDPKDRERVERVLAAEGEDGIVQLYGPELEPSGSPVPVTASGEGQQAGAQPQESAPAPGSNDLPFEGEEPPPIVDEPEQPAEEPSAPVFTHGRFKGKTIEEVYATGKDGVSYLQWSFKAWKTNPIRAALGAFAKDHPEVAA